ncbi:MAG: methyltransferase domain-containing protein [Betaproteobacteria bacterium]|nr:methyltransferase domain-containing protein [Betaproteobacteria bacterium]MBU6511942.1 methyltransferase domain-containing protein [Betaproteobacteria bacterium]MDE2152172.1 class I SAM-dependent methyltransferase [Betaproteobacteria bacterium]MDE2477258.1 class I SAM-dependent methyltransferase [Betaproteobacteria bacterium]
MTQDLNGVREHYAATGVLQRLRAALATLGPEDRPLTPRELGAMDQFHTRGHAATAELAELAAIGPADRVLDLGCGIGGPARLIADSRGCRVTGLDLSEGFVEAARYLSLRTGQQERVQFHCGSALAMDFADASFDVVLLQHVAMNIADRERLYREIRRVLAPGGRFATYDVVRGEGEPLYPAPWARDAKDSFLLDPQATREAVEAAGLRVRAWRDDTQTARDWAAQLKAAAASAPRPSAPGLGVVMGPDFPVLAGNHARNLLEGRVGVLMAVFEAG